MRNPKYYIAIDEHERRIIMGSLNNLKNKHKRYLKEHRKATYTTLLTIIYYNFILLTSGLMLIFRR